ncbi:MAG: addiction module protein [Deltaproteobacteria bacterium RBG_13_61_14]|nr:MAG: addiction module protein [Deltaproteobacteria bacterium RBG_13_61_14]
MHTIQEIIREASELPVEDRANVIDSLLRTLNAPNPDMDRAWSETASRRLRELRSGRVQPVPGDRVFAKIKARFAR